MSAQDDSMLSAPEHAGAGADDSPVGGPRRPSATSVRPKGILKNAPSRQVSVDVGAGGSSSASGTPGTEQHRLQWDEGNLALHDYEREQTTRMTIDEPKTPFVSSASLAPDDVPSSFSLDDGSVNTPATSSYFPAGTGTNTTGTGSRRGSTASSAEITARNTLANAQLGRRPSSGSVVSATDSGSVAGSGGAGLGLMDGSAVESMAVDELEGGGNGSVGSASAENGLQAVTPRSRNSSTSSRTPSFSIPRSGSTGAHGAADTREQIRAEREMGDGAEQDEIEEEEEDEETKAKHAAFAAKRNQHYGNEAQAMRIAAALAAQEGDEDDDDGDEEIAEAEAPLGTGNSVPPVPPLPRLNGNA